MKKKTVLLIVLVVFLMVNSWLIPSFVMSAEQMSNNETTESQQTEPKQEVPKVSISQDADKYFKLGETQSLLQQKILITTNLENYKKENERLQIQVPVIQDKKPEQVVLLMNGKKVEEEYYQYNKNDAKIQLDFSENKEANNLYKIIYLYQDLEIKEKETVQFNTTVFTKMENLQEIETQDNKTIELIPKGDKVSIEGKITNEVYKGYLYEAKQNDTEYEENYIVEISNTQDIQDLTITSEKQTYVYGTEEKIADSTYFKETSINKEEMLDILGQEGKITIKNSQGEIISELTKDSQENEEKNLVISYPSQDINNIVISTTKPIKIGELNFKNKKAIAPNTGYTKEQLKQFEYLKDEVKVNNATNVLQMKLLDTKPEAEIKISNQQLLTMQTNENVQITATLKTNDIQYDLYKNPSIEIVFPKGMELNVKTIKPLNISNMEISAAKSFHNEEGETIVQLQLEGEQLEKEVTVAEGIQLVIITDITIDKLTPTQKTTIKMRYTNENRENEINQVEQEILLQSKQGALLISRVSNYNENGDILESTTDKIETGILDANSNKQKATVEYFVINNYEKNMVNPVMIGKMPDSNRIEKEGETMEVTFGEVLESLIHVSKEGAKVFYSEDVNATKESSTWKETVEDLSKVKAYKIEFGQEKTIAPKEMIKISYQIEIPENLPENQTTMNRLEVNYIQEGREAQITATHRLETSEKELKNTYTLDSQSQEENLAVKLVAVSAGKNLEAGEEVYEGQAIEYTLEVTNQTANTINNLKMKATHTNANYYGIVMKKVGSYEYPYREELEDLTCQELTIESLEAGGTTTFTYEIVIKKQVEEGENTTGEIILTGNEITQTTIKTVSNPIKQAKLKLKIEHGISTIDKISSGGYAFPLSLQIENISEEELRNIVVTLNLPETIYLYNKNMEIIQPTTIEKTKVESNQVILTIPKLDKSGDNQTAKINLMCTTQKLDLNITSTMVENNFSAVVEEETYFSNKITREIYQVETIISLVQEGSIEGKYVKDGDTLVYTTTIKNEGKIEKSISLQDNVPYGVDIQKAELLKGNDPIEFEINILSQSINIYNYVLQPEEEIILKVTTKIRESGIQDKNKAIINVVSVSGRNISKESNEISYQLQAKPDNPDPDNPNPDNPNPDNPNPDNPKPDNPDPDNPKPDNPDPDNPNPDSPKPDNPTKTKSRSISGKAWIDNNKDGIKDNDEESLKDINVFIFNQENGDMLGQTITNSFGKYEFKELSEGKYFIVFQYDTSKYQITQYQATGVNESKNSDVVEKQITILGRPKKVAMTQELVVNEIDFQNIDAGFIPKKVSDLKLDKYIQKITIKNKQGTKEQSLDRAQFAKVEIKSKYLAGSVVTVEYQIQVTNEGEIPEYVTEILDYLPEDFSFSTNLNSNWYQKGQGTIATKQLENQVINPGEKKQVTLIVTKNMTQANTGTSVNKAEIGQQFNKLSVEDVDSVAGNQKEGEDDQSKAEVIISISTGEVMLQVSFIILIIAILVAGIYVINKKLAKGRKEEKS